ncbi:hypothetical protein [Acidocella sp.]|uniref:hypothetical protein n=1 Tax=Acidocella sp. TaxID=50710 RepID=UPI003CFF970B
MSESGPNDQDKDKATGTAQAAAALTPPAPEPAPAPPEAKATPEPQAGPKPEPRPEPKPESTHEPAPQKPRRSAWPVWFGLGFVILAGGEGYLFAQQQAHQADKTQLAVLRTQVADMRAATAKTAPLANLIDTQAELAQKQAALAAQVNAMQGMVTGDHGALAALQANAQDIGKLTARMARLNDVAAARMALESGQPLGVVQSAPPALQRFADTAPPTMAWLRESFPAAARAAEAASLSNNGQAGFWAQVKLRLEGLITIANGTHVIFGPPATAALRQARAALENDDLAKAVQALQTLSPPTQAAMASWLTPARQLLAARAALAQMAQQQGQ